LILIPFLGPLIAFVLWFYILYVTIKAYSLQHQITLMNAFIAVIAPMVILIVIGVLIGLFFLVVGGGIVALSALPLIQSVMKTG
jgi:hypothetical protein